MGEWGGVGGVGDREARKLLGADTWSHLQAYTQTHTLGTF